MRSLLLPAICGLIIGGIVPHEDLMKASGELIAFVSLLMAGLLPAMTLTATVLRGDSFSAARVRDYGERLHKQLQFWGGLFAASAVACLLVTLAKVLDGAEPMSLLINHRSHKVTWGWAAQGACATALAAFAVMLSRLWPAFLGLKSLLTLSVTMAEAQALANDRVLSDALQQKAERAADNVREARRVEWPAAQA